jgi:hypothetical protein
VHLIDPLARQIEESGKVVGPAQPLRLEAANSPQFAGIFAGPLCDSIAPPRVGGLGDKMAVKRP